MSVKSQPWLSDHVIYGTVVVPGATYAAMALAAGALVPLGTRPLLVEERVDDRQCLFRGVHAATDADQLGVVVLPRQLSDLHVPCECTACALDLVRGDLLAVAGAAEHDAQRARIRHHGLGGGE